MRLMEINSLRDKYLEQPIFTLVRSFYVLSPIPRKPVVVEDEQKLRQVRDSRIIYDFVCCKVPISKSEKSAG